MKTDLKIILKTAEQLFAQKGYDSTTMDEIAEKASVNKATIYYHIGGKQKLYEIIIEEKIDKIKSIIESEMDKCQSNYEKIFLIIDTISKVSGKEKTIPKIMLKEISSGMQTFPPALFDNLKSIYQLFRKIILQGIENGDFVEDDPVTTHAFLMSSALFANIIPSLRSKLSEHGIGQNEKTHPENEIKNFVNLVLYGIAGRSSR